jgi:hypothetical protein
MAIQHPEDEILELSQQLSDLKITFATEIFVPDRIPLQMKRRLKKAMLLAFEEQKQKEIKRLKRLIRYRLEKVR